MGRDAEMSRGSITVFFACFFPLFMLFFSAVYTLADYHIAGTLSAQIVQNSCTSTLGEFDRKLEKKFGLYAVKGEAQCAFSVSFYLDENLCVAGPWGLPSVRLTNISVKKQTDLSSLIELRRQISSFMEYRRYAGWAEELLEAIGTLDEDIDEKPAAEEPSSGDETPGEVNPGDIFPRSEFEWKKYVDNANKLTAAGIELGNLPSYTESLLQEELDESDESSFAQILLGKLKNLGPELLLKSDLVLYCTGMFSDFSDSVAAQQNRDRALSLREKEKMPGFFQNEVEYILWGFGNETANIRATKYEMVALRILFNMAAFTSNPVMMEKLMKLAEEISETVGLESGAILTKILLISWCWAEAEQDYKHLAVGDRVPFLKNNFEWEVGGDSYVQPETGWDYSDHLKILLALVPTSRILARVSDLIFLEEGGSVELDEYVCAFSVEGMFKKGWISYSFEQAAGY